MKLLLLLSASVLFSGVLGWGSSNHDRVLLADMKAVTLENGKMTTGRRSSPVPQLSCVGGTAGCYGSNQPRTVQCLNRGSDGNDAQWECKATLDNAYQFGRIRVVCEGFDYPDDPYILKGSCGLEYELDYTEEGRRQGNSHHGSNRYHGGNNYQKESSAGGFGALIQFVIVVAIIYFLCTCMRGPRRASPGNEGAGYGGSGHATGGGGGGGPGFWSGAATGGALGYMFGNRGNNNYGYGRNYGGGWGSGGGGWGSGGSGWGSSRRSGSSSSSSSSRTTSGFGGTGRR